LKQVFNSAMSSLLIEALDMKVASAGLF
jgi:hypothetical protein